MADKRLDCSAPRTVSPDPRGKAACHPSPNPAVAAPQEEEELSVCTSSCMPPSMQRSSAWRVDQFQLHKQVYEGRTSRLYLATDIQSGTAVALKLYRKRKLTALNRIQVEREINIHVTLAHENIIKLYAAFEDEKNVYLVLEVAEAGDLFHHVKTAAGQQYSERKAVLQVIVPFLKAMTYLHEKGIIHRDVKPENILISSSGVLKLADFGLAIDLGEERPVTRLGTLDYMAPEVLLCPDKKLPEENKDRSDLIYSSQVDVWALGILTFEILSGRAPFERDSRLETYEHILNKEPEYPACISEEAKRFIKAALVKDPTRRPTASSLLEHPWIRSFRRGSHAHSASSNNLKDLAGPSASGPQDIKPQRDAAAGQPADCSRSLTTPAPMPWADLHVHIQAPQCPAPKHRLSCSTSPDGGGAGAPRSGPSSATHASTSAHSSSIFPPDGTSHQSPAYYSTSSPGQQAAPAPDRQGSAFVHTIPTLAIHTRTSGPTSDQSPVSSPRKLGQGPDTSSSTFHSASSNAFCHSPDASAPCPLPRLSSKPSLPSAVSLPGLGSSSSFTKPKSGVLSCDESLIKMGDSMMSLSLAALLSPTPREHSQPTLSSGQLQLSGPGYSSNPGTPQRKPPSKATPLSKGLSSMTQGLAALLSPSGRKKAPPPPINVLCGGGSLPTRLGAAPTGGWLSVDPRAAGSSSSPKAPTSTRSFPARLFSPAADSSRGKADGPAYPQAATSSSDLHIHIHPDALTASAAAAPLKQQLLPSSSAPYDLKPLCLSPPAPLGRPKSLRAKVHQEQLLLRTDSSPQLHQAPGLMLR